jgi:hypothetical protein
MRGEHRVGIGQVQCHPGPLRALPGEDEDASAQPAGRPLRHAPHQIRRGPPAGQRVQAGQQLRPVRAEDDGPVVQRRPAGKGVCYVRRRQLAGGLGQPLGHLHEGRLGLGRQQPRNRPRRRRGLFLVE